MDELVRANRENSFGKRNLSIVDRFGVYLSTWIQVTSATALFGENDV